MRQNWRLNSLLMEILIAVLFFALCAGLIVNTFATSSYQSTKAGQITEMLDTAQNVADRLYASEDMTQALKALGFEEKDGGYARTDASGEMTVTLGEEATEAGMLKTAHIDVVTISGGELSLNTTRYWPKEVR